IRERCTNRASIPASPRIVHHNVVQSRLSNSSFWRFDLFLCFRSRIPMAVNLPPQYHDAEARYKKAQTPEDKLTALKEMWVILPKHKASEKVQAELKTKISELT